MFVSHTDDVDRSSVAMEGARGVLKQILIGPGEGWDNHVMRQLILEASGNTPRHSHPWPHINYITSGEGVLYLDGEEHRLTVGSIAYVPGNTEHQFINRSNDDFSFLCIVPLDGEASYAK